MVRWDTYFTPPDVASVLVNALPDVRPDETLDLCAGGLQLLRAARKRWPATRLIANDLHHAAPARGVVDRNRRDGRLFAIDRFNNKNLVHLALANPPFGRRRAPRLPDHVNGLDDETLGILASPRIEWGMLAANALLVKPGGYLGCILPATFRRGSATQPIRDWFHRHFEILTAQRLPVGLSPWRDVWVCLITARRRIVSSKRSNAERRGGLPAGVELTRGSVSTPDFRKRGGLRVIHCAGKRAQGYTVRRSWCGLKEQRRIHEVRAGDIVITRVGKQAGRVALYQGPPGVASDCIFRLRASAKARRILVERQKRIERALRRRRSGTVIRVCSRQDVESVVRSVLEPARGTRRKI
jgi:hypothetical protein